MLLYLKNQEADRQLPPEVYIKRELYLFLHIFFPIPDIYSSRNGALDLHTLHIVCGIGGFPGVVRGVCNACRVGVFLVPFKQRSALVPFLHDVCHQTVHIELKICVSVCICPVAVLLVVFVKSVGILPPVGNTVPVRVGYVHRCVRCEIRPWRPVV